MANHKNEVRAKKYLGQHFLTDENIAFNIVKAFTEKCTTEAVLEIGPGMGVLTQFLLPNKDFKTYAIDLDKESIVYLKTNFPQLEDTLIEGDFLRLNLKELFPNGFSLIGNFPYNISSQIVFTLIENRDIIPLMVGMFQKEVGERLASKTRTKDYGILSVFTQAYFEVEYLFTVHENVFNPPPKVKSGVVRLTRKATPPDVDQKAFFKVVKAGFNQRRKKLRNALSQFKVKDEILQPSGYLEKRAEELTFEDFIILTKLIQQHGENIG
jgi:16S rRNA (adenine1518-N6/adenine1519-N6)-dimethyltransferase